MLHYVSAHYLLQDLLHIVLLILGRQKSYMFANRFASRIPQEPFCAFVPIHNDSVHIHAEDGIIG